MFHGMLRSRNTAEFLWLGVNSRVSPGQRTRSGDRPISRKRRADGCGHGTDPTVNSPALAIIRPISMAFPWRTLPSFFEGCNRAHLAVPQVVRPVRDNRHNTFPPTRAQDLLAHTHTKGHFPVSFQDLRSEAHGGLDLEQAGGYLISRNSMRMNLEPLTAESWSQTPASVHHITCFFYRDESSHSSQLA